MAGISQVTNGWYITSYYQCIAGRPQYTLTRSFLNELYGEYEKKSVTQQSQEVEFTCTVTYPNGDPTARCQAGTDGGFYFIYETGPNAGKLGGAALTASLITNSDAK